MVATKPCIKCEAVKPLGGFYSHPGMRDGYLNRCKECSRAAARSNYAANRERVSAYDAERQKRPERRAQATKRQQAGRQRNPQKFKARAAVSNALRAGRVVRQSCEACGSPDTHGHHDDYSKPLDVRWLCFAHHAEAHGKIATRDWVIPAWRRQ